MSLATARVKHVGMRKTVMSDKVDPLLGEVVQTSSVPTFASSAAAFIAQREGAWKNDKHIDQWKMTTTAYCKPIANIPIDQIGTADVLKVLTPMWTKKPETASRLRGRIEAIIDAARALGHIEQDKANPARWKGHLDKILPKRTKRVKHHAALPYVEVPAFVAKLKAMPGAGARALEFAILTAARSGEVFGMAWEEVTFAKATKLWTVPADRMKTGEEHVVPLSDRAVEILAAQRADRRGNERYVFPGMKPNAPLSTMALEMTMRRLGAGEYTPHGFRSSFRDWAHVHGVAFEIAE